jgi:hypothetical protein
MTLYPDVPEAAKQQAAQLIEEFKKQLARAADDVISTLYTDVAPHIESDAWINVRNSIMDAVQDYPTLGAYDGKRIREAILAKHREAIVADLNADAQAEIKALREENTRLRADVSRLLHG